MKKFKQIKEAAQSKSSPVVKKKGFIPKGFVTPLDTKPTSK